MRYAHLFNKFKERSIILEVKQKKIKTLMDEIHNLIRINEIDKAFHKSFEFINDFESEVDKIQIIILYQEYLKLKTYLKKPINNEHKIERLTLKLIDNLLIFLDKAKKRYLKLNEKVKITFIKELKISNYKILDDFSINFQDKNNEILKTVVLAGINGSGKTSILEYISFNFENSIYFPIISDSLDDRENLINNPKKLVIDKIKAFIDKIKDENLDLTVREANQKAIDSINDTFKDIELSVKFNGISTDIERRLLFKNKKSDNIWLEELSTGEQQLFIRALSLKLLEPKEQIILIDEPETSLHPSWQQSILKVYENIAKEGNNQLIIATHSPHIISSAKKESVKILVNIDGNIKVLEDISGSYGFEVSRVLTELMGLKSLRVADISKKIEKLWNLIYEEKQDEYQKLYEELEAILGKDDKDIILSKLEIAKNKSRKC